MTKHKNCLHFLESIILLVFLFPSTEGGVQQDSSHFQLILHNLVQLLWGKTKQLNVGWKRLGYVFCTRKRDERLIITTNIIGSEHV